MKHRIAVDYENNADEFWANFGEAAKNDPNFPRLLKPLNPLSEDDTDEILTDNLTAFRAAEEYVSKINGYSNGPKHAETALLFYENYSQ
jgi:hypothetical protein